ncbi:MAG TPA: alcohol dehydrogenase catalytic domain-containing protein [Desulfosporosinus sp.]|nr:alcohol dehydrogenase catalytic domain-containing protein [Desulfosporosinus sp.]
MKATVWKGAGRMKIENLPTPTIGAREVLIKVKATGICGSDLTIFQGKFHKHRAIPPMVLGHEFSGDIVEIGKEVKHDLNVGDRVFVDPLIPCGECYACREGSSHVCSTLKLIGIDIDGAFAEYVKASADRVYLLPERLTYEEGCVVEPLAVAVHAVRRAQTKVGDAVLVVGGGPVGVLIALVAICAGANPVVITEIQDYRTGLAETLGIKVVNPLIPGALSDSMKNDFAGIGPNIAFEVTGTEQGTQQSIDCVRIRGTVVQVGAPKGNTDLDVRKGNFAELSIVGSRVYGPADIQIAINLLATGKFSVTSLYQTFPFEECSKVFQQIIAGDCNLMKPVILPPKS